MISTNVFNIITTYIDWKSKNFISDVILTNKSIVNGYIKFINEDIWFKFTTKDHLKDWIKHTQIHGTVNDVDKILECIIETCFRSEDEYKLFIPEYDQYILLTQKYEGDEPIHKVLKLSNFTFIDINEDIGIITEDVIGESLVYIPDKAYDITIIDDILDNLVKHDIKVDFKKILYNALISPNIEPFIFYDTSKLGHG